MSTNEHVTIEEMARRLGCCRDTVLRMLRRGDVPGIKVGRDWRVDPQEVIVSLSQSQSNATKRD